MGKFTKKLKKGLKKAAPLIMAGLAAKAMMGRRGPKKFGTDAGFLKSAAAGGASLAGHVGNRQALAKRLMTTDNAYTDRYTGEPIMTGGTGAIPEPRKKFLGIFKKGGRVTGIAKRGFGRALKKK